MAARTDPELVKAIKSITRNLRRIPRSQRAYALPHLDYMVEVWARVSILRDRDGVIATAGGLVEPERITTPEDTLRDAGVSGKRQAAYQRKLSTLLSARQREAPGKGSA